MSNNLTSKYDIAAPRYTSYPTVPYWNDDKPETSAWLHAVKNNYGKNPAPISLYIHLLFCESLCTYCACNTRITTNHKVEAPYIDRLIKEWEMYPKLLGQAPEIGELHFGGGTPTFFSPQNLKKLIDIMENHNS